MSANDSGDAEVTKWDPGFTKQVKNLLGPLIKRYFRAEVRGMEHFPAAGGALVVSNHSGGMFTPDVLVFAPAFYDKFGYDRPLYTLVHYGVLLAPVIGTALTRAGAINASRQNAAEAMFSGGVVLVFPGGDYDAYRSVRDANTIDFEGRTGYVRTALETGVPIVPMVSIGAQESQLFLARGDELARKIGLHKIRLKALPLTFGFPFGLTTVVPPNLPLPSKIVTEVLEPIDVVARFGEAPDIDEVDQYVRSVMQTALDELARQRRFPLIG
jgi:1-acyl-sn-glycerol-3-phosphate acyltransferase